MSNMGPDQPSPQPTPPPPPPPPQAGRRRPVILAISAIVIIAIVAVGLVFLLNQDDGETPTAGSEAGSADDGGQGGADASDDATETPAAPEGWSLPAESVGSWEYSAAVWITDDALVHATNSFVSATDLVTGEALWDVPVPQIEGLADTQINYCGASENVQDGLVALAFGPALGNGISACGLLHVVDITTGEGVWHAEVVEPHEFDGRYPEDISVDIIDGTVVASWSVLYDNTIVGYDLAEGSEQWRTMLGEDVFDAPRCDMEDLVAAKDVAVIAGLCDTDSIEREIGLARIDPSSGSVADARVIPRDELGFSMSNLALISHEPLIIRGTNSDKIGENGDSMIVFDDGSFEIGSVIAAEDGTVLTSIAEGVGSMIYPSATIDRDAGVLVATLVSPGNGAQPGTELVAYDLSTGDPVWAQGFDDAAVQSPIGVADGNLLAWVTEGERGHRIATLDLATGEVLDAGAPLPGGEDFYAGFPGIRASVRYFATDGWVYAVRTDPGESSADVFAIPQSDQ